VTETGPAHRTVSLHELHVVGPHGLPVRHRTVQVVRALRPGLASYTFRFDRREASVRVLRGATAREPRPDVSGFTAVELCFPRPLRMGETASLEYETSFDWRSVPPPQLRRAARTPVERLEMRVAFTPGRLPADLHWALWDGYGPDARMRAAERVELDDECSAHRFTDEICGMTVGFTWTWPPGQEPQLRG
jgi:hypothetical protein